MGHHLVSNPIKYENGYFQRYRELDKTQMGADLTFARTRLVLKHCDHVPVDIGVGGGRFVESMGCYGYDVNPFAVEWLKSIGRFKNPYTEENLNAITCWDSLEHLEDPRELIDRVKGYVFVSIPIFNDSNEILTSKHYRPGEHLWYWSRDGFVNWFDELGFDLLEQNTEETTLGRENIMSFVFKRRGFNAD